MENDIWVSYFITLHKLCLNSMNSRQRKNSFCNKSYFYKSKSHMTSYPAFKRATELALPVSPEKRLNLMSKPEVLTGNSAKF